MSAAGTPAAVGSAQRVLVLGATGMLGHTVLRLLAASAGIEVHGTARSADAARRLPEALRPRVQTGIDATDMDALARCIARIRPALVVNGVGIVKQLAAADDPLVSIPVNALLPHRLAALCRDAGARLVHVSTDCVFSGARGGYTEDDAPDPQDLYGRSKLLGEVDAPGVLTLRTSIIGPELGSAQGLVGWLLNAAGPVRGYTRAIFSGLPTVELARVLRDVVLPRPQLQGLYHLSAAPISKHELLGLVARAYGKAIDIVPSDTPVIDRSLDSGRFRAATGYAPPDWPELVRRMHAFG